jgi:hypothetical protein
VSVNSLGLTCCGRCDRPTFAEAGLLKIVRLIKTKRHFIPLMIDRDSSSFWIAAVAKGPVMKVTHQSLFRSVAGKTFLLVANIPLPLSFIAGCHHKAVLAADVFAMPACLPAAVNEVELKPETVHECGVERSAGIVNITHKVGE